MLATLAIDAPTQVLVSGAQLATWAAFIGTSHPFDNFCSKGSSSWTP